MGTCSRRRAGPCHASFRFGLYRPDYGTTTGQEGHPGWRSLTLPLAVPDRAAMKTMQLNHVALHVADVVRSCDFYGRILRLEPIPRPAFSFPGAWFRLGSDQELHLIGQREQPVTGAHSRGNHWALLVDDISAWEEYFRREGVEFTARRTRPDGAWQIYVYDPDGHCLELCTEPGVAGRA